MSLANHCLYKHPVNQQTRVIPIQPVEGINITHKTAILRNLITNLPLLRNRSPDLPAAACQPLNPALERLYSRTQLFLSTQQLQVKTPMQLPAIWQLGRLCRSINIGIITSAVASLRMVTYEQKFVTSPFIVNTRLPLSLHFIYQTCLGQETAKGPNGFRLKLPPEHLSTTHRKDFASHGSFLMIGSRSNQKSNSSLPFQ